MSNEHNIRSMTGYGRARGETAVGQFTVELRSVNNRFADVSVALPRELAALETPLRKRLQKAIGRGKIDCRVRYTPSAENQPRVTVNEALAREYIEKLRVLQEAGASEELPLQTLTSLPGVLDVAPAEIDTEALWAALAKVVDEALAAHRAEREREGAALAAAIAEEGAEVRRLRGEAEQHKGAVVEKFRARLTQRVAELEDELKTRADPGKLEMEIAMFADRCDITEELVRLEAHLDRLDEMLRNEQGGAVGKNLDFLVQEFVREINTLCSKARETEMTGLGLAMKTATEKIREQVQNIE